jgi:hypothetical protein
VEVAPHAREIQNDVDAELGELRHRPDPRQQEQLRRSDRPRADHNLRPRPRAVQAAGMLPLHAHAAGALHQQPARGRPREDP